MQNKMNEEREKKLHLAEILMEMEQTRTIAVFISFFLCTEEEMEPLFCYIKWNWC